MITGIGVDIVDLDRVRRIHDRYGEKFARRILTEAELADYSSASSRPRLLAKRFAAKEAAVKALGSGFSMGITLNMIGIHHDEKGRPLLEFSSRAEQHAASVGVSASWLSISDEAGYAVAMVVLESVAG